MYWPAHRSRPRHTAGPLWVACFVASLVFAAVAVGEASGQRVDRGAFRLFVNGVEAGVEEFEIQRRGEGDDQRTLAKGTVEMRDGSTLVTTLLATGGALALHSYQARRIAGGDTLAVTMERADRRRLDALTRGPWGEEVREYRAPDNTTVVLDEGVAHHYFVLGGLLRGPVPTLHLLSPVVQAEAEAEAEAGSETIRIGGEPVATTRVRLRAEDGERVAWFDGSGRLVRVEVPARGFVAERVLGPADSDAHLPADTGDRSTPETAPSTPP